MQRRRIVLAAAMVTAAGAAVAVTLPSMASTSPSGGTTAGSSRTTSGDVAPKLLTAMQRDLGVDADQVRTRLARQQWAGKVSTKLSEEAGSAWAGAWLGKDGTTLNVAVTDADLADEIQAAGAQARVVERSSGQLNAAKQRLDATATRAAKKDLPGWYVDVATNRLVVLAEPGDADAARQLVADADVPSDSVTVKTTRSRPRTLADVRGADPYFFAVEGQEARCSIGFAVQGGFVTAGHCGGAGTETLDANQQAQGVVQQSTFPGDGDFGFVEVNADATPRGVINDFQGNEFAVGGSEEAPVGAAICRSGSTTGVQCGTILAKNQTVNYPEGSVTGLTQTDVCAEGGDSGGPWVAGNQAQGVTSGGSGDCEVGGETFFQPLAEILETNDLQLITDEAGDQGDQGGQDQSGQDQGGQDQGGQDQGGQDQGGQDQGGQDQGGRQRGDNN